MLILLDDLLRIERQSNLKILWNLRETEERSDIGALGAGLHYHPRELLKKWDKVSVELRESIEGLDIRIVTRIEDN